MSSLVLTCWRERIGWLVRRSICDHLRRWGADLRIVLDVVCIVLEVSVVVVLDYSVLVIME